MTTSLKIIYWSPRILCIAAIAFVSLFALDAFDQQNSFILQLRDFFIHLIPSFILSGLLFFAWKKELFGGIVFTSIGVVLSPIIFKHNYTMNHSIGMSLGIIASITLPFIIVGILFIVNHFLKKKQNLQQ